MDDDNYAMHRISFICKHKQSHSNDSFHNPTVVMQKRNWGNPKTIHPKGIRIPWNPLCTPHTIKYPNRAYGFMIC